MTPEEQVEICKIIIRACMWGYGGVGEVILDKLQEKFPTDPSWHKVHASHKKQAEYEAVGVIKDEDELKFWLSRGYWLTNYSSGELSLFYPPPRGGLCYYVLGELADKYGELHDLHNWRVAQHRAKEGKP